MAFHGMRCAWVSLTWTWMDLLSLIHSYNIYTIFSLQFMLIYAYTLSISLARSLFLSTTLRPSVLSPSLRFHFTPVLSVSFHTVYKTLIPLAAEQYSKRISTNIQQTTHSAVFFLAIFTSFCPFTASCRYEWSPLSNEAKLFALAFYVLLCYVAARVSVDSGCLWGLSIHIIWNCSLALSQFIYLCMYSRYSYTTYLTERNNKHFQPDSRSLVDGVIALSFCLRIPGEYNLEWLLLSCSLYVSLFTFSSSSTEPSLLPYFIKLSHKGRWAVHSRQGGLLRKCRVLGVCVCVCDRVKSLKCAFISVFLQTECVPLGSYLLKSS